MEIFYIIVAFVFGLVVGSFLNVCIYRLPRGKCKACGHVVTTDKPIDTCPKCNSKDGFSRLSIIRPGSHCPHCKTPIHWSDNIPLVSYLVLGAKCRNCKAPISFRYPLVEFLTGILFAGAYYTAFSGVGSRTMQTVNFVIMLYLVASLIIITFIDFDFRIIPDEITISGILLAILISTLFPSIQKAVLFVSLPRPFNGLVGSLAGIIAGGGVVYLVGVLGKLVFRKEAMGFGDVKLMAFLGGFLGWDVVLYIFFLGCFFGSIAGIISWAITKDRYIPFGPYLALGALVMLFFQTEIVTFTMHTYPGFIRNLLMP